jgi:hypothetical protein
MANTHLFRYKSEGGAGYKFEDTLPLPLEERPILEVFHLVRAHNLLRQQAAHIGIDGGASNKTSPFLLSTASLPQGPNLQYDNSAGNSPAASSPLGTSWFCERFQHLIPAANIEVQRKRKKRERGRVITGCGLEASVCLIMCMVVSMVVSMI